MLSQVHPTHQLSSFDLYAKRKVITDRQTDRHTAIPSLDRVSAEMKHGQLTVVKIMIRLLALIVLVIVIIIRQV